MGEASLQGDGRRRLRSGERVVPDQADINLARHLVSYRFACDYVKDRRVLDLGCGTGYGAALLAQTARSVLGVDVSAESVAFAREKYGSDRIAFETLAAEEIGHLQAGSFGAVVCNQVLEHIRDAGLVVAQVARLLEADGVFVTATPNRFIASPRESGFHFHEKEWSAAELEELLREHFDEVELHGQFETVAVAQAERVKARRKGWMRRLYALDFLKLRRLLPERFRRRTLADAVRRLSGGGDHASPESITEADYEIRQEDVERAENLIAVARRGR